MKKGISYEKIIEVLFWGVLVIQICFLFKFNLSDIRESLDADFSYTVYHYMQVIKAGTLNLQDWNHTTSLELDATFLFAWPIYYLVHDIFKAVGISNILIAALYITVIYKLLSLVKVRKSLILMSISLVLTPYAFGMLDYFNMMFYGGACYSIKVLIPLMALLLMLWDKKPEKKNQKIMRICLLIVYVFLFFISTFSTGIYVAMCGLIPIILCTALDIWKDGTLKGKYHVWHLLLLCATVVDFVIAMFFHQKFYGLVSRTSLNITKYSNWDTNLRACLIAPFQILGATTTQDIKATSTLGIFLIFKIALVSLLLVVAIIHIPKLFQKTSNIMLNKYCTMIFIFNFLLLVVADCRYPGNLHIEYRYLIIGIVPLFVLLATYLQEISTDWNAFQLNFVQIVLCVSVAFIVAGNNRNIQKNWDRTGFAVELGEYLQTLDVESVFMVDDTESVAYLRAINQDQEIGSFRSEIPGLELLICSYKDSEYGRFYGHKNAVVIFNFKTLKDYFEDDISMNYKYVGSVRWFDVYISDEVYF